MSILLLKQLQTIRGKGAILRASLSDDVTPEKVRNAWDKVTDMSKAERMSSITEATGSLVEILDSFESNENSSNEPNKYTDNFTFGNKDLILYALGSKFSFEKCKS